MISVYKGHCSYIPMVKWWDFMQNMDWHIMQAEYTRDHIAEYDIHRNVNQ